MPDGRTTKFAIWRACERFRMLPPGVKERFDDCTAVAQAELIAFDQIRTIEDTRFQAALAGAKI